MKERTRVQEIERSILKGFRKTLWSPFTKAVKDYGLIQEGDKIAVCISGGKDSMLLAKLMQEIQRHGERRFELVFLSMDPGYNPENRAKIVENAEILGIPIQIFDSKIFDIVTDIPNSPCYLCARMRRGTLYKAAQDMGCNKIALGHHMDDVIETTLLNLFYGGQIKGMLPKLPSQNFEGMMLIRPMVRIRERDVIRWARHHELSFLNCACRFTEDVDKEEKVSKRKDMKELIRVLEEDNPFVAGNIFESLDNVNLEKIYGTIQNGVRRHFMKEETNEGTLSGERNDLCGMRSACAEGCVEARRSEGV